MLDKLVKYTVTKLKALKGNSYVYNEKVPEDVDPVFPYIVFSIGTTQTIQEQDLYILELDLWHNDPTNTGLAALEALVNAIDGNGSSLNPTGLNEHKYFNSDIQAWFQRISRLSIPDPEPTIRRRQLRYLVKTRFLN